MNGADSQVVRSTLPVELLEHVIDYLAFSQSLIAKWTLLQCLLVSKAFYQRSRIYVFADIRIRVEHGMATSLDRFATFNEILRYQNRYWDIPLMSKNVQSLTIDFGDAYIDPCLRIINSEEFLSVFQLLRTDASNLRSLTITKQDRYYIPWLKLPPAFVQALYHICLSPSMTHISLTRFSHIPALFFNTSTIKHLCLVNASVKLYSDEELLAQGLPPFSNNAVISPCLETLDVLLRSLPDVYLSLLGSQEQVLVSPTSTLTHLIIRFPTSAVPSDENRTSLQAILFEAPLITSLEIENFHQLRNGLDLDVLQHLQRIRYSMNQDVPEEAFRFSTTILPNLGPKHDSFDLYLPFSSRSKRNSSLFNRDRVSSFWIDLYDYFTILAFTTQVKILLHIDIINDEDDLDSIETIEGNARRCLLQVFYSLIAQRSGRFQCFVTRTPFHNESQLPRRRP